MPAFHASLARAEQDWNSLDARGRVTYFNGAMGSERTEERVREGREEGAQARLARQVYELETVRAPLDGAEAALGNVRPDGLRRVQLAFATGATAGLLSDAEQELYQMIGDLRNKDLRAISGAAVTESEQARYMQVMGAYIFDNDSRLRTLLRQQRVVVNRLTQDARAGYTSNVTGAYDAARRREGATSTAPTPAAGTMRVRGTDGRIYNAPEGTPIPAGFTRL